jgi:predicted MPP superfamily phosphohydrolase
VKSIFQTAPFVEGSLRSLAKDRPQEVLFMPDMHFPFNLFFDSYLDMWSNNPPDILILGGDNINNDPFNHWAKKKPRLERAMPRVTEYYQMVNLEFYKKIREAVGEQTVIVNMLGNHEEWSQKAIDMNPINEGLYEVENNVKYVDFHVNVRRLISLGDMSFAHGDNIPFGKSNHTKKMGMMMHRNLMHGHYHDYEVFSLTTPVDEKKFTTYSVPCSTDTNPCSYGKEMPSNRSHGFASLTLNSNGKTFPEIHQIKNGEFFYKDRQYKSKQTKPRKLKYEM